MNGRTEDVRLAVYDALARFGAVPAFADVASSLGLSVAEIEQAVEALHGSRDLVLDDGRIVLAHPFATIPLGFSVMGPRTLWWGGCAWDSFAIPHLLELDEPVLVATTCPGCGAAQAFNVDRHEAPVGSEVAHFLTPTARIWDDVVHSCAHQRIFCDEDCVDRWLSATRNERGYVMDLGTLWRLARGWYAGRLQRGYKRREPVEASEYFRSVGLHGSFWGLED